MADLIGLDASYVCATSMPQAEKSQSQPNITSKPVEPEPPTPTTTQLQTLLDKLRLSEERFTPTQWQEIKSLLQRFYHSFSHNSEIGLIPMKPLSLKLSSEAPTRIPPYKYSQEDQQIIDGLINDLLEKGILERSASGIYGSPIVLVKARNKPPRLAFDLRILNRALEFQAPTSIPNIQDLLVKLRHAKIYSTFDVKRAYFHVPVDDSTSEILSVSTPQETYKTTRLPFGLNSAPHLWSRIIKDILAPVDQTKLILYLDDMCLFDVNFEGLRNSIESLLQCIHNNNIKLSPEKCHLFVNEITLLGHFISPQGIKLSFDSTERVRTHPPPKNVKQLQAFIGLANWAMKWIPHYGTLLKPLFQAVKHKPFKWTEACQKAFDHVKLQICSEPVLKHYDDNLPLFLITDASLTAFGCTLAHRINDIYHPIFFYGRCFSQSELKYNIFEKELKGLYNSVRALSPFLKGKKFTIMIDNAGVSFLKTLSLKHHSSQKWGRWISYLSEYDFEIKRIPTTANPADTLSRRTCGIPTCTTCQSDAVFHAIPFKFDGTDKITPKPIEHVACQTPQKWLEQKSQHSSVSAITAFDCATSKSFHNQTDINSRLFRQLIVIRDGFQGLFISI